MALFTRREQPPAELLALLEPDERVVSWADTADGDVVALTPLGVWWPEPAGGMRRVPWHRVNKAVWRDGSLVLTEADIVDDAFLVDRAPVAVRLQTPRDLPPTLRKRVEGNIGRTELVTIAGGAVRFASRRVPGQDGVSWWARLEPGTPDTEEVRSAVRARLAILRRGA